jgi:hypothetical protein
MRWESDAINNLKKMKVTGHRRSYKRIIEKAGTLSLEDLVP